MQRECIKETIKELYESGIEAILIGKEVATLFKESPYSLSQLNFVVREEGLRRLSQSHMPKYSNEECFIFERCNTTFSFGTPTYYGIMKAPFEYEEKSLDEVKVKVRPLRFVIEDYERMKERMEKAAEKIGDKDLKSRSVYKEVEDIIEFLKKES